jgi:hypothetical protein
MSSFSEIFGKSSDAPKLKTEGTGEKLKENMHETKTYDI